MSRGWGICVLVLISPAAADDDAALLARIIDADISRVPVYTVAPEYPRKARRDRIEGEVQVCFHISRSGTTRSISVRSSTNRAFERPSTKAVRASTFRPLKKDQALAASKSCRTFVFSLQPVEEQWPD